MTITPPTSESQVINGSRPAMLFSDNMINFMREEGNFGGNEAVFAMVLCALDNLPAQRRRNVCHETPAPVR